MKEKFHFVSSQSKQGKMFSTGGEEFMILQKGECFEAEGAGERMICVARDGTG